MESSDSGNPYVARIDLNYSEMKPRILSTSEHLLPPDVVTIKGTTDKEGQKLAFELSKLGYDYDALEPAIDARTMRLHHDEHHRAYIEKLNKALAPFPKLKNRTIEDLLLHLDDVPEEIRTTVRNSGGGHLNHELFWKTIGPPAGAAPQGALADGIHASFGNLESLQQRLTEAALKVFGSGWAFLAMEPATGKLEVVSLPNQDVVMLHGKTALLACDVWEHSYYLKYENRRPEYLKAFWDVVQWQTVSLRLEDMIQKSLSVAT
jgi:Fe-Mn family superoxide dismutase